MGKIYMTCGHEPNYDVWEKDIHYYEWWWADYDKEGKPAASFGVRCPSCVFLGCFKTEAEVWAFHAGYEKGCDV